MITPRLLVLGLLVSMCFPHALGAAEPPVPVPGTGIILSPPAGFTATKQFPGFAMESTGASLMVTDMPAPFAEVSKAFTEAGLKSRGMKLLDRKTVNLGGQPDALLFRVSQRAGAAEFFKWIGAMGNAEGTKLIVGTFLKEQDKALSEPLRLAVLSARPEVAAAAGGGDAAAATTPGTPTEGVTFAVDEAGDFKIARKVGNNLLLTRRGEFPQKGPDDPMIVVGASATAGNSGAVAVGDRVKFAADRVRQTESVKDVKILSERDVEINGLPGRALEAQGKDDQTGRGRFVAQTLLWTPEGYYILQGLGALEERESLRKSFGTIFESFRQK